MKELIKFPQIFSIAATGLGAYMVAKHENNVRFEAFMAVTMNSGMLRHVALVRTLLRRVALGSYKSHTA
jgi:hypothetical protein